MWFVYRVGVVQYRLLVFEKVQCCPPVLSSSHVWFLVDLVACFRPLNQIEKVKINPLFEVRKSLRFDIEPSFDIARIPSFEIN